MGLSLEVSSGSLKRQKRYESFKYDPTSAGTLPMKMRLKRALMSLLMSALLSETRSTNESMVSQLIPAPVVRGARLMDVMMSPGR